MMSPEGGRAGPNDGGMGHDLNQSIVWISSLDYKDVQNLASERKLPANYKKQDMARLIALHDAGAKREMNQMLMDMRSERSRSRRTQAAQQPHYAAQGYVTAEADSASASPRPGYQDDDDFYGPSFEDDADEDYVPSKAKKSRSSKAPAKPTARYSDAGGLVSPPPPPHTPVAHPGPTGTSPSGLVQQQRPTALSPRPAGDVLSPGHSALRPGPWGLPSGQGVGAGAAGTQRMRSVLAVSRSAPPPLVHTLSAPGGPYGAALDESVKRKLAPRRPSANAPGGGGRKLQALSATRGVRAIQRDSGPKCPKAMRPSVALSFPPVKAVNSAGHQQSWAAEGSRILPALPPPTSEGFQPPLPSRDTGSRVSFAKGSDFVDGHPGNFNYPDSAFNKVHTSKSSLEMIYTVKSEKLSSTLPLSPYWRTANTNCVDSYATPIVFSCYSPSALLYGASPNFGKQAQHPSQPNAPIYSESQMCHVPKPYNFSQHHSQYDIKQNVNCNFASGADVDPQTRQKPHVEYNTHQSSFDHSGQYFPGSHHGVQEAPQAHQSTTPGQYGYGMGYAMPSSQSSSSHSYEQDRQHWGQQRETDKQQQLLLQQQKQQKLMQFRMQQQQLVLDHQRRKQQLELHHQQKKKQFFLQQSQSEIQNSQQSAQEKWMSSQTQHVPQPQQSALSVHHGQSLFETQQVDPKYWYSSQEPVQHLEIPNMGPDQNLNSDVRDTTTKHSTTYGYQQSDHSALNYLEFRGQNNQLSYPLIYDFLKSAEEQVLSQSNTQGEDHGTISVDDQSPLPVSIIENEILPTLSQYLSTSKIQELTDQNENFDLETNTNPMIPALPHPVDVNNIVTGISNSQEKEKVKSCVPANSSSLSYEKQQDKNDCAGNSSYVSPEKQTIQNYCSENSSSLSPRELQISYCSEDSTTDKHHVENYRSENLTSPKCTQNSVSNITASNPVTSVNSPVTINESKMQETEMVVVAKDSELKTGSDVASSHSSSERHVEKAVANETSTLLIEGSKIKVPSGTRQIDATLEKVVKKDKNCNEVVFMCNDGTGEVEYLTLNVRQDEEAMNGVESEQGSVPSSPTALDTSMGLSETLSMSPSTSDLVTDQNHSMLDISGPPDDQSEVSPVPSNKNESSSENSLGLSETLPVSPNKSDDGRIMGSLQLLPVEGISSHPSLASTIPLSNSDASTEKMSNISNYLSHSESALAKASSHALSKSEVKSSVVCNEIEQESSVEKSSVEYNNLDSSCSELMPKISSNETVSKDIESVPLCSESSDTSTQKTSSISDYLSNSKLSQEMTHSDAMSKSEVKSTVVSCSDVDQESSKKTSSVEESILDSSCSEPLQKNSTDVVLREEGETVVSRSESVQLEPGNSDEVADDNSDSSAEPSYIIPDMLCEPLDYVSKELVVPLLDFTKMSGSSRNAPFVSKVVSEHSKQVESTLREEEIDPMDEPLNLEVPVHGERPASPQDELMGSTSPPQLSSRSAAKTSTRRSLRCSPRQVQAGTSRSLRTTSASRRPPPVRLDSALHQQAKGRKPCPNADNGCGQNLPPAQLLSHHLVCEYTLVECPDVTCGWRNIARKLCAHIREVHREEIVSKCGSDSEHNVLIQEMNEKQHLCFLREVSRKLFVITVHSQENNIYACIQYIAAGRSDKPIYAIGTLEALDTNGAPIAWRGAICPFQQKLSTVYSSGNCLKFSNERLDAQQVKPTMTLHAKIEVHMSHRQSPMFFSASDPLA